MWIEKKELELQTTPLISTSDIRTVRLYARHVLSPI